MSAEQAAAAQDLSFPVKVYVGLVHLLLLFLVVLFLQRPFKGRNDDNGFQKGRKSRTLTKDNRAVTIESCEWINSTLAWFYMHAQSNDEKDRTPNIVKFWLRALNKQLQKDKKKNQKIIIDSLSPGCLPPKLTSVYCLCVRGNMQCITFHVETADLGFLIRVLQQTGDGPKATHLETRVVKLTGEVALQLSTSPSKLELSAQFIGIPEIAMSTKCLVKDGEVDGAEIQEKVKEVICKTITSIPLADASSRERVNSDAGSSTSKDRLDSPSSISCVGEEGKLLVKVIKASGLCGKDKSGPVSPYCVVSTSNPLQRKRTSMVRDNDSPFWNEYFTFDISPKTKEITLDIYNYEKTEKDANGHLDDNEFTEEQDDYLGQVIVPLSTVNRDQTCRLILPVLPRSSKSEHSKGDISLEFTFDKDGKVIDASLPLISGSDWKASSREPERTSAHSSPSEESPSGLMNGDSGVVNGHAPVRKRYIESSLDELAMEIEAYEQSDEDRPKAQALESHREPDLPKEPELRREPVSFPVVVPVPKPGPSRETEQKEEDEETAIAELLKSTEGEETDESKDEKEETQSETFEVHDKGQEAEEIKGKDDEDQTAKEEEEEKEEEPEIKPKHRRSFNLFKRKKSDKKMEKVEEKLEDIGAAEDDTHEDDKNDDTPAVGEEEIKEMNGEEMKEGEELNENAEQVVEIETKPKVRRSFNLGRFKRKSQSAAAAEEISQEDDKKEEAASEDKDEVKEIEAEDKKEEEEVKIEEGTEDDKEKANGQEEAAEQPAEFDSKPKMRRSFNLFRRRPQSMAAADRRTDEDSEDRSISRHDPVRHSYHAGDLPVPDPSNLRKSTSQSSLLSYSPNPNSTLVIETINKGEKKYWLVPPVMAKRKAYEKGGNKLHIYNDHIFTAVHFTGSPPDCGVCAKSIKGIVGKQGYQCRGCKMVAHRDCHYETTAMCSSDAVKQMEIVKMPQFVGH